jgi:uncharacterized protein YbjT (DUF2867 family)
VLAESLLSKGHEVRALGRDAKKLGALAAKGAKTRPGAFLDAAALAEAFAGAEAAFVMIRRPTAKRTSAATRTARPTRS